MIRIPKAYRDVPIGAEDPQEEGTQGVGDDGEGAEVVHLFRERGVPGVEDGRPEPRVDGDEAVQPPHPEHGGAAGDLAGHLQLHQHVRDQVQDGEQGGGRLLHAKEPEKWALGIRSI